MDFTICPISQVDQAQVLDFANRTWGKTKAKSILSEWWLHSDHSVTMVALDHSRNRLAGIVVAIKSQWPLTGGLVLDNVSNTVSICGWYVAPEYAGHGLGRLLVQYFDDRTTSRNTLAITQDAVRAFKKLGWTGPFHTQLLLLPLPLLRRRWRPHAGFSLASYEVQGPALPKALAQALTHIEQTRPTDDIRQMRPLAAWRAHMGVWPDRRHRFHVVMHDETPIGVFVMRGAGERAKAVYRWTRLQYVSDIVMNRTDAASLSFLADSIGSTAPRTAGGVILCSSNAAIVTAMAKAGWLSEHSAIIGKRLASKAPLFMLAGRLAQVPVNQISMTFSDSDVDFNL
jgi:GNAT superfamily N-acetyltransferase